MKQFIKGMLSDGGSPSSSRAVMLLHSFVACGVLVYLVAHTKALPDWKALIGLGGFVSCTYGFNTIRNLVAKDGQDGQ